jgi:hypothetical protein
MAKEWLIEFKVQPISKVPRQFPIDMLRYDSCYPASNMDSVSRIVDTMDYNISAKDFEIKSITLIHLSHGNKNWTPTNARWESFGYKVIDIQQAIEC